MVDEIARLGVAVDSTSAASAAKNLDNLADSGKKAEASVKALGTTSGNAKQSMAEAAAATGAYAKTANELRFATRGLPAQFTDIAVSLQAGQNPLTVFLQQGGQLKDMFGGAGPAAKALGGYVMGLINPLTLAAAAAVTLAVAWHQGEAESTALNKALIMQGKSAEVATGNVLRMSEAMDRGVTTQHQAALALTEVAASGKIAVDQFEMVAQAAINMERATGTATEDTVAQFTKIAEDPVTAVTKLNESFHFLTAAQYENIKSLQEQGDTLGAASLAMEAYADAVNKRSAEVVQNLGTLEKGWYYVKVGAAAAWDAMLGIGRDTSGADKFDELAKKLQEVENPSWLSEFSGTGGGQILGNKGSAARKKYADSIRAEMQALQNENIAAQKRAGAEADRQLANDASIRLSREISSVASNAKKRETETNRVNEEARKAIEAANRAGETALAEKLAKQRDEAVAGIDQKYKDPKVARSKADLEAEQAIKAQAAEYERLNKSVDQYNATLSQELSSSERLTAVQRFIAKTISDMENGHSKLSPTQQKTIRNDLDELAAKDRLNEVQKERNKLLADGVKLQNDIAVDEMRRASQADRELRSLGHSGEVNDMYSRMDAISDRAAEDRLALAERTGDLHKENTQIYLDQLRMIDEAEQRQLNNEKAYFERRKAAQADWRNGAQRALEEIQAENEDVAGQTHDAFITAYGLMEDAIDQFTKTGKFRMKDFVKYVLAELLKLELRILTSKIISYFGQGMAPSGGASAGVDYSGAGQQYGGVGGLPPANLGAAFDGGAKVSTMALGGVITGSTLFPLAKGGKVLGGEAGPEGIVPLERMSNGKLGVASKGGSGGDINVHIETHVHQDGSSTTSASGDDNELAKRLGGLLDSKVKSVLVEEMRQGGILWSMQNR